MLKLIYMNTVENNKKVALVTGAYGGIGLAVSKALIKNGYDVIGLDIEEREKVDNLHFYKIDITNEKSIIHAFRKIEKQYSEIDTIIHLAGIYDLNSLIEMDEEDFEKIFDINVFGVYRVNKVFIPLLKKKGKIVITTSELAPLDPLPFTGIYGITKATLDKYAYSLRMELQLLDYQVVVLRPGAIKTGLLNVSTTKLEKFTNETNLYKYNATKFKEVVDSVEAKSITPEKLADFLCKIINKKKPKYVYSINRNPFLRLLNILPKRTQNWIIKKILETK